MDLKTKAGRGKRKNEKQNRKERKKDREEKDWNYCITDRGLIHFCILYIVGKLYKILREKDRVRGRCDGRETVYYNEVSISILQTDILIH